MTFRSALRRPVVAAFVLVSAAVLAGCASRSLNPPPIVERSTEIVGVKPAPGAVATAPDGQTQVYTVKRDDTLFSIARRFNTTPNDLIAWNNLPPDSKLRIDQTLRVSPPGVPPPDASSGAVTAPVGNDTVEQRPLEVQPATPVAPSSKAPLVNGPFGQKKPYSDAAYAELARPDASAVAATPVAPVASTTATGEPNSAGGAPVNWAWPAAGKVTATFVAGKSNGIDIGGNPGDAVLAASDGKVTFSGSGVRGYGNFVIVRHSPELLSVYAHNKSNLVKEGAIVTKGQKIAEMGSSDAPSVRLHFEIRSDSKPMDPLKYLPER